MMQINDNSIRFILIVFVLLYIVTLIVQLKSSTGFNYISWLNAFTSAGILLYWMSKQLLITLHFYDRWEITLVCIECLFTCLAIYSIRSISPGSFVQVSKYVIYGFHAAILTGLLLFMLTFKINRLF